MTSLGRHEKYRKVNLRNGEYLTAQEYYFNAGGLEHLYGHFILHFFKNFDAMFQRFRINFERFPTVYAMKLLCERMFITTDSSLQCGNSARVI